MRVPGSNLLSIAMRVLTPQPVQWRAYVSRAPNGRGILVDTYTDAVTIESSVSVQPIPRNLYQALGLDFAKEYWTLWVQPDVQVLKRDVTGDLVIYEGLLLKCESDTNWRSADGWRKIQAVRVPAA